MGINTSDNTLNNQPVTHGLVWRLALPMILSGISIPLVGMVDTAVVGRLPGPQFMAAVALASLLLDYVFFGFGFLRMGTTGLAAQDYGRQDWHGLAGLLLRASVLGAVFGVFLLLVHQPILQQVFSWIDASEEVKTLAKCYFSIHILGAPALFVLMVQIGWLLGVNRALSSFILVLIVNITNAVLDVYLGLTLGWGVDGVAWAAVIAEYVGVTCGFVWCAYASYQQVKPTSQPFDWSRALRNVVEYLALMKVNGDIFIRTLMLTACFTLFTLRGAERGDDILAANALLLNFLMFTAFGLDGFAQAAESLVGRFLGARQPQSLRKAVQLTGIWSLLIALGYVLFYGVLGEWMINRLSEVASVREVATTYLPWLIVLPMIAVWSFWVDGIFIGATWTRDMRNMMGLALIGFVVIEYASQSQGNHGSWMSMCALFALRGLFLGALLPRNIRRWRAALA